MDGPTYQDLINSIGDLIKTVDDNTKRELDKLCSDVTLLRGELNDTRRDITLMREEMNGLRVDMSDMRGTLNVDMIKSDAEQCQEIELIKREALILGDKKAKLVGVAVSITGVVVAIVSKLLGVL